MSISKRFPAFIRNATLFTAMAVLFGALESPRASDARDERAYLAENDASMARMMAGMALTPSGDIDRDFVAMMVPHHQGAIDMARALITYGSDERLKRIAQEIIVTQQEEIVAMRRFADAARDANRPNRSEP
jgi:uncharacterized protein (DUF305 family)